MTRRDFFSSILPSRWVDLRSGRGNEAVPRNATPPTAQSQVAVIAGRHCLAYQGSFCSTCRERCPIEGAIVVERGLPRVNATLCNGCRICHELCPAPVNAIRLVVAQASSLPGRTQAGSLRYLDHA
jgi:MinD superfamily P-loop ATPase